MKITRLDYRHWDGLDRLLSVPKYLPLLTRGGANELTDDALLVLTG
jgi:hypothetical protein